jgi:hypothetical protein
MVKLDFDAPAHTGDVAARCYQPEGDGQKLNGSWRLERAYDAYTKSLRPGRRHRRQRASATGRRLQTVGGLSAVPANGGHPAPDPQRRNVQSTSSKATDSSTQFIGAPTLESGGGPDPGARRHSPTYTGIWPEHPSFADNGVLGARHRQRGWRACNFGDNPLTPAVDVFQCNHKVIGGQPFLATYNALVGGEVYTSARDSGGHGTHTTSTAAGDIVASTPIFGIERGPISGVAPGAWVIEYKVCGLEGCFSSDSAAAVQQAVKDGADVINFSISGGSNPYTDAVELAFLGAYDAGVFVAASAGNSGPTAATTDHQGPWVTTVAASTQTRAFQST